MPSNLPPGATIDDAPAQLPPGATIDSSPAQLPAGATIDSAPAAPPAQPAQPSAWQTMKTYDPTAGILSGALKEAQKHVAGAIDLVNKYVIAPDDPGATENTRKISNAAHSTAEWLRKNTSQDTLLEQAGGWGESGAEILAPEMWGGKAIEGMSYAERLGQMAKNAKTLEANPGLLKVIQAGAKSLGLNAASLGLGAAETGAKMGTQAYIESGGDKEKAKEAALTGAVTHGAIGALGAGVAKGAQVLKRGAAEVAPEVADIGGVKVPRVAEAAPGSTQAAQAEAQQSGLQQSFGNVVNRTVSRALEPYDIDPQPANHFGDASEQIRNAAVTDFDELAGRAENLHGEAAGQKVRALNQAVNDAPLSERGPAKHELFSYLDSIDDPRYPDSLRDVAVRARNTYEKKFMADDLHQMLGKYFNFASPETAEMMDKPYSLELAGKGDNMKAALRKFEEDYGRDAAMNFLGKDGFRNLHQMADVASDPVYSQNADNILRQVMRGAHEGQQGKWVPSSVLSTFSRLPFMKVLGAAKVLGGAAGGVEAALPMLKYQIATNPRVGALLTYAAKTNVSPRYVAPFIAAAIHGELNPSPQPQPTGAK